MDSIKIVLQKNEKIVGAFVFAVACYAFYRLGSNFGEFLYYLFH